MQGDTTSIHLAIDGDDTTGEGRECEYRGRVGIRLGSPFRLGSEVSGYNRVMETGIERNFRKDEPPKKKDP